MATEPTQNDRLTDIVTAFIWGAVVVILITKFPDIKEHRQVRIDYHKNQELKALQLRTESEVINAELENPSIVTRR